jgi:predicted nucleotidyltransferase
MIDHGIDIPPGRIAEFCRRNHIRRPGLFGSILRDNFGPNSDVDVLVEFEAGRTAGPRFSGIQDEVSTLLGQSVGSNTLQCLGKHFRDYAPQKNRGFCTTRHNGEVTGNVDRATRGGSRVLGSPAHWGS